MRIGCPDDRQLLATAVESKTCGGQSSRLALPVSALSAGSTTRIDRRHHRER
jgi:hypothetical protein